MSELLVVYIFLAGVVLTASIMSIVDNGMQLKNSWSYTDVEEVKRRIRWSFYSAAAAPLWPLSVCAVTLYGFYRLLCTVSLAFK